MVRITGVAIQVVPHGRLGEQSRSRMALKSGDKGSAKSQARSKGVTAEEAVASPAEVCRAVVKFKVHEEI